MLSSVQSHVPVACPPIRPPVCPRGRCAAGKRGLLGSEVLPDGEAVLAAERGCTRPSSCPPCSERRPAVHLGQSAWTWASPLVLPSVSGDPDVRPACGVLGQLGGPGSRPLLSP